MSDDTTLHNHSEADDQVVDSVVGTAADKLENLTEKEKHALNEYLQEDHIAAVPHDHTDTEIQSFGERVFNIGTYKGIGVVANVALSLYITDRFKNGGGGKLFKSIVEKLAPKFERAQGISKAQSKTAVEAFLVTSGLTMGGLSLLYPIKKLEDHKPEIVKWIDDQYNQHHNTTKVELAIQEAAHKRLEQDAKPKWSTIIIGRAFAMVAVFGTMFALKGRDKKVTGTIVDKTSEAFIESQSPTLNRLGRSERFQSLLDDTLMETYQSFIAEEALYFTTRMYKNIKRKEMLAQASNDNAVAASNISEPQQINPEKKDWAEKVQTRGSYTENLANASEHESLGMGV